jgi:hypothetical protein
VFKITIHIGAGKTGSSAIQLFLKENAAALAEDGILVPPENLERGGRNVGNQVWFFDGVRQAGLRPGDTRVLTLLNELGSETGPAIRQVVLSAENLSNPVGWHHLFAPVGESYKLEVVLYVRRQDDFLLSAWQQWYCKQSDDFWSWLTRCIGVMGNWRLSLQEWEKIVPVENIHVRIYERPRLIDNDVVHDFTQYLDTAIRLKYPEAVVNPSFNTGVLDLISGNDALFTSIHDNGFFRFIEDMTGAAHAARRGESFISYEQRMAILARYEQSNRWVREKYIRETDVGETLFSPPTPDDCRQLSRREIDKQKWDLIGHLLYQLYSSRPKRP